MLVKSVVFKDVQSFEWLLDEMVLFLYCVVMELLQDKQEVLQCLYGVVEMLCGCQVLVVDDDVCNIFVLIMLLENQDMWVLIVMSGCVVIDIVQCMFDFDFVLMDIMMLDMDGYEMMCEICFNFEFCNLLMFVLMVKVMKGDCEKCLEVGVSDYIFKFVNIVQLLLLMCVWLYC